MRRSIALILLLISFFFVSWVIYNAYNLLSKPQNVPDIRDIDLISSNNYNKTNQGHYQAPKNNSQHVYKIQNSKPIPKQDNTPSIGSEWGDSNSIKHQDYVQPQTGTTTKPYRSTTTKPTIEKIITKSKKKHYSLYDSPVFSKEAKEIWSWIPSGLKTHDTRKTQGRTETSAIRDTKQYINAIGHRIKQFTTSAGNQSKMMQTFVEKRGSEGNEMELTKLADKYTTLGSDLTKLAASTTDNIPRDIVAATKKLSHAYQRVGMAHKTFVQNVPAADKDSDSDDKKTYEEVIRYNKAIDSFAQDYLPLVSLLSVHDVKFNSGDGGDIFMSLH